MKRIIAFILLSLFLSPPAFSQGYQYVNPYIRSDGTYVQGHYKTAPNNNAYDNWSTKGNSNPYTGQQGYVNPYSNTYNYNNYNNPYNNNYQYQNTSKKSYYGNDE